MKASVVAKSISNRNKRQVIAEIIRLGPLPRTEIARRLRITEASVSRITRGLLDAGLVEEVGYLNEPVRPGRKRIGLQVRAGGGYVAAISVNIFRQDIVIANIASETVVREQLDISDFRSPDEVLRACAMQLNQLIDRSGIDRSQLFGCGVTLTGAINPADRQLINAFPISWRNVDVDKVLKRDLGMPFVLESISNAKNLAARCCGPTRSIDNTVLFNCSMAIGCSIMSEGRLLRGSESSAGLIESLKVPDESGALQPLNSMAAGFGIINKLLPKPDDEGNLLPAYALILKEAIEANSDDPAVPGGRSLREAGEFLGFAVMAANAFLHPQRLLISGPLVGSSVYCDAVKRGIEHYVDGDFVERTVEFFQLSSYEAAQSLAISHFLMGDTAD